jgi:hypothetical protein
MKPHNPNKGNAIMFHPHQTDEKNPDIFLNVDLVTKPASKKYTSKKNCKNCCDQCRAKEKKANREHPPLL